MSSQSSTNRNVSVVISFLQGSFERGYPVAVKVMNDGKTFAQRESRRTPEIPELVVRYGSWRKHYLDQGRSVSRSAHTIRKIDVPTATVSHSSIDSCRAAAKELSLYLDQKWFKSSSFESMKDWIGKQDVVQIDKSIPVFFEFDTGSREQDTLLRRLPWLRWDLFKELPNADPAIGISVGPAVSPFIENIKILLVLGSDEGGLDLEADEQFISALRKIGAQVTSLPCPEPRELYSELKNNPFDILFFAGHSLSEEDQRDGTILLKPNTSVSVEALGPSLRAAVRKGLKLAVFNSCDGLGLADPLIKREKIPSVVVFREPVPDEVARTFLNYFLQEFSKGSPLFIAVREARNQLRFLEDRYENPLPGASWLPVVCQNPNQEEIFLNISEVPTTSKEAELQPVAISQSVVESQPAQRTKSAIFSRKKIALLGAAAVSLLGISAAFFLSWQPKDSKLNVVDGIFSIGEEQLLSRETTASAQQILQNAHSKFQAEDYNAAAEYFIAAIRQISSDNESGVEIDPELVIYLNNSIAMAISQDSPSIGVSIASNNIEQTDEVLRGIAQAQSSLCGVKAISESFTTGEVPDCTGAPELFIVKLSDHKFHAEGKNQVAQTIRELAEDPSILGIVSRLTSGVSFYVEKSVLQEEEIVLVSPTSTADRNTAQNASSGFLFRPSSLNSVGASNLASYIRSGANTNILVIGENGSPYSESMRESFEAVVEENDVDVSYCDISNANTFDVSQCFDSSTVSEIDVILAVPSSEKAALGRAINVIQAFKDNAPIGSSYTILGGDPFYDTDLVENYRYALDGMVIPLPWHRNKNPKPFERDAEMLWGTRLVNWRTAMAYDSGQMLIQATETLSCEDPAECRLGIQQALTSQTPIQGATGNLLFDRNGDRKLTPEEKDDFEDDIGVLVEFENTDGMVNFERVKDSSYAVE